jgi:hypothetical protein
MDIIYSGKELRALINESIPGYKPKFGNNASPTENEKINKESNKKTAKDTEIKKPKEDFKPVKPNGQSTDLGNNKNMLDLEFDYDPGEEYEDRVKKQVTGEDSKFGNKPDEKDSANNIGNKAFYNAAKNATSSLIDTKNELENSGFVGKSMPIPTKGTPFSAPGKPKTGKTKFVPEEISRTKKLNFKNTQFLSERHMFSLIPEDYKKDGNKFIMKDKTNDEYLIEWKVDEKTNISEGMIEDHQNKDKIKKEFSRIKSLYEYKSETNGGNLTNLEKTKEDYDVISENIKKLKEVSDE